MSGQATTHVEIRDIYQTVRLEGAVEAYDSVAVRAPKTGTFAPVSGLHNGRTVRKGASLGTVSSCPASGAATGSSSGTSSGDPKPGTSASPTTGATCRQVRTAVTAPVAGKISGLAEQEVAPGTTVATIQPPGFHIRLPVVDASLLYRFAKPPKSGKAEIVGGPSGFTVRYEKRSYDKGTGQVSVYVSVPRDMTFFAGLHAVVVFVTGIKDQVPTLPLSAVHGKSGKGEVVTVDRAGKTKVVKVTLGESDDLYVEVHGIDAKADVLLYPLESDFDE